MSDISQTIFEIGQAIEYEDNEQLIRELEILLADPDHADWQQARTSLEMIRALHYLQVLVYRSIKALLAPAISQVDILLDDYDAQDDATRH